MRKDRSKDRSKGKKPSEYAAEIIQKQQDKKGKVIHFPTISKWEGQTA
jgi:hypothetical protein